MESNRLSPPRPQAVRRLVAAVVALSNDRGRMHLERYGVASRDLDAPHSARAMRGRSPASPRRRSSDAR